MKRLALFLSLLLFHLPGATAQGLAKAEYFIDIDPNSNSFSRAFKDFYKNHFIDFYQQQDVKVKEKIKYVLELIKQVEKVPKKFIKHLAGTSGLYEIRIEYQSNIYRIFSCFDKGKLVILFNGFQKKTQKTPKNELEKALSLMEEYLNLKNK